MILNYHIQYMLYEEMSPEEMKKAMNKLEQYHYHRKWLKKLHKNNNNYKKYMEKVQWL